MKTPAPRPTDASSNRDRKFNEQIFRNVEISGSCKVWPASTAPEGWIELDGTAISRTAYPQLFTLIGTTYGVGDGSTTFNVPNWAASAPSGGIYIMKA